MQKTIIQENWKDYTFHICNLEIPQSPKEPPKKHIEVRRSALLDAAYVIVRDGVPEVVDQKDIWKIIRDFSMELFRAFGIYKPVIGWESRGGGPKVSVDDEGNFVNTE